MVLSFPKSLMPWSLCLLLAGCADQHDYDALSGEQLFNQICADCHRQSGKGSFLEGIPANAGTRLDREQLIELITEGSSEHKKMPVISQLDRQQAGRVADYLKTVLNR
ncbi:cytochrome c [Motiliproteus coralliicola]|uniref:Cytochrome c n=1 Tax=Motiliproteus coralliicola TaxID=2283196 RepID=A0A369WB96_9GAMM|nr:cytochrome c [Motiliproteus coralliicola]RDE19082.1 cytochrome c [Motiliproteus coralliicola]